MQVREARLPPSGQPASHPHTLELCCGRSRPEGDVSTKHTAQQAEVPRSLPPGVTGAALAGEAILTAMVTRACWRVWSRETVSGAQSVLRPGSVLSPP